MFNLPSLNSRLSVPFYLCAISGFQNVRLQPTIISNHGFTVTRVSLQWHDFVLQPIAADYVSLTRSNAIGTCAMSVSPEYSPWITALMATRVNSSFSRQVESSLVSYTAIHSSMLENPAIFRCVTNYLSSTFLTFFSLALACSACEIFHSLLFSNVYLFYCR
jgi:hypothetical protein